MKQGTGTENYPKQTGEIDVEWSDTEHLKKPEKKANMKKPPHDTFSKKKHNTWKWELGIWSKKEYRCSGRKN